MRIGITCHPGSGVGCIAGSLADGLAGRGHEVHLISYANPSAPDAGAESPHLRVHEIETPSYPVFHYPPYLLALATGIADVTEQHGLQVLHLHGAIPHALAATMARDMIRGETGPASDDGPRIVTTIHGGDLGRLQDKPAFRDPVSAALRRSDGLTAVSEYLKQHAAEQLSVCRNRMRLIPPFVDRSRYKPLADVAERTAKRRRFAADDELLVIHVSRFRPQDRAADAICAFSKLRDDVPARLVVVGEGPEAYNCRMQASARGLRDDVVWLGNDARLCQVLPLADLVLITTEVDYSGAAALQAMAAGRPVVAYEAGGLPEVILHGRTGSLVATGDIDAMAREALELATDPDRLDRTGRAARDASAPFAEAEVVARYESYYQEICGGRGESAVATGGSGMVTGP